MTQEEKINELAYAYRCSAATSYCSNIRESVLNMAEWQKQQLIKKAVEWVKNNAYRYTSTENDSEGYLCEVFLVDGFINDFQNHMEK